MSLLVFGLLAEVVGHVGKVLLLRDDLASETYFSLYMMGTLWGPTFIGAAVCVVLPHVMVVYGREFRLVAHTLYANLVFVALDIFTLAFLSVGVVFSSGGNTVEEVCSTLDCCVFQACWIERVLTGALLGLSQTAQGVKILIAGLAMQAAGLVGFFLPYWYFRVKLARRHYVLDPRFQVVFLSARFNRFLLCKFSSGSLPPS